MKILATTLCLFVGSLAGAHAAIVGGAVTGGIVANNGGTFEQLTPSSGFSVGNNNFDRPDLVAFNEKTMRSPIEVNGDVGDPVPVGVPVASHYVFFDPENPHVSIMGYVDFDARILSVLATNDGIHETQAFGLDEVQYLRDPVRGIESYEDQVWIDPLLPYRLWVSFFASRPGDHLRVLTAANPSLVSAPLPLTAALMATALAGLGMARRRA